MARTILRNLFTHTLMLNGGFVSLHFALNQFVAVLKEIAIVWRLCNDNNLAAGKLWLSNQIIDFRHQLKHLDDFPQTVDRMTNNAVVQNDD